MTSLNVKPKKESFWHWIAFLSKAYIIAVPAALLICQFIGNDVQANKPYKQNNSQWDARLQARVIEEENAKIFRLIETVYVMCLVVLVRTAIFAVSKRDKNEFRITLIFMVLTVISMIVFYLNTLIVPR